MNCAIYIKGSNEITYFIRDCIQTGRDFRGSNCSVTGVKEHLFDVLWTDDLAQSGSVGRGLTEAKRYQGRVVSTPEDVDKVTRELIAEKYPVNEEIKLLRLRLSGDDTGWKEYHDYQSYVDGLVKAGRAFKEKNFQKEK